jgi:hypothetical protein
MNPNLPPAHRLSRGLARTSETEKEMWRASIIATRVALGLASAWAALVLFAA